MDTQTLLFFGISSALLSILISYLLVHNIEKFFEARQFSVVGIGLLSALAADTPEITSAMTAVIAKQPDIGLGVIIGSNIFNFAALLGLPVLINKTILFERSTLIKLGLLSITNAIFTIFVGLHFLSGSIWFAFSMVTVILYLLFISDKNPLSKKGIFQSTRRKNKKIQLKEDSVEIKILQSDFYFSILKISGALVLVIILSVIAEHSFAHLGGNFHLSEEIVGGIILAAITSLPNAVAAIYLAKNVSGDALLSEAINSNTINVIAGVLFPAAVFSSTLSVPSNISLLWLNLIILTVLLITLYMYKKISYPIAIILILIYMSFVVYVVT